MNALKHETLRLLHCLVHVLYATAATTVLAVLTFDFVYYLAFKLPRFLEMLPDPLHVFITLHVHFVP